MARRKLRALTFVELFIVIIIIGILAGLSMPNLRRSFDSAQAEGFSRQLQSYMNYLRDKSVVDQKVIYLSVDTDKHQYSAWVEGATASYKTFSTPKDINIEILKKSNIDNPEIYFYPDGRIDKMDLTLSSASGDIVLTTEGVFGKVKINQK
ncbi:MAG: hypothetical protein WCY12_00255 [Candidatus Omnitrophota bacterium]